MIEQAQLQEALRQSEERLRGLDLVTPVGIFHADLDGSLTFANAKMAALWGMPERALLDRGWTRRVHPADLPGLLATWAVVNGEGQELEYEYRLVMDDGDERAIRGRSAVVRGADGEAVGVVGTVEDVTRRLRAEQERERLLAAAQRAARSARLLQAITAAFSAVLTPTEVVGVVLDRAVEALGAATGLVTLVVDGGRALDVAGARGYEPAMLDRFRHAPLETPSVIAAVARTGRPLWLNNRASTMRDYPAVADIYASLGFHASTGLPLVDGRGRVIGVLAFNYTHPHPFDDEERALLTALAHQCAQALERARLFEGERAAREEAQRRRAEAEEANAAKSRFLATTSHEIRTPINAILGYTELLEMGIPGPLTDEQGTYLSRVRLSSQHLLGIVNQVLDLSKIEADKIELRVDSCHAGEAAARAAALVEAQAVARGVTLLNACESARDVVYMGDPDRVEQVLVNLLGNAVKFTPPGGRVTITCGQSRTPPSDVGAGDAPHGWTYFRVEDTGVGVPASRVDAIWEPFEQADVGHTRAYGGTGLGLTISRRLARLMRGDITLHSEHGAGSTFLLWLPSAEGSEVDDRDPAPARRERRARERRLAPGLGKAADAALSELERVLSGYSARLRTDPGTRSARALSDAEIEDHSATFLADMAQCLSLIEAAKGAPSETMRDASAIQRVIAERHGAQRARLGWSADEVRREFAILREELAAAVRRRMPGAPADELSSAIALFAGFIEHAERTSLQTHRAPPAPER